MKLNTKLEKALSLENRSEGDNWMPSEAEVSQVQSFLDAFAEDNYPFAISVFDESIAAETQIGSKRWSLFVDIEDGILAIHTQPNAKPLTKTFNSIDEAVKDYRSWFSKL